MITLVGLGNPGKKYQNNRHNVGQMFIDYLVNQKIKDIKLIKTDCFMNESGRFIKTLANRHSLSVNFLIVVHDDLDIPFGKFHIQKGVGPRLHNGIESIEQNLKTKDFWRIRIGVDNRLPDKKIPGETYVLQNFLSQEKKLLESEIFPKIFSQLKLDFKML